MFPFLPFSFLFWLFFLPCSLFLPLRLIFLVFFLVPLPSPVPPPLFLLLLWFLPPSFSFPSHPSRPPRDPGSGQPQSPGHGQFCPHSVLFQHLVIECLLLLVLNGMLLFISISFAVHVFLQNILQHILIFTYISTVNI